MKALFVGLGSIGQRHLRNLKELDSKNNPIKDKNLLKHYSIKEIPTLKEALEEKPDMVFVTNPSMYHCKVAKEALISGAYVFIEKPLSSDIESAEEILNLEKKHKRKLCMIGFQYRFNPTLIKLKEILETNTIGKLITGQIVNGEYLPYWHPYEDYRKGYAARKDLGGGALLTQIHDFDYSIYLFGLPLRLFSMGGKLSSLEIDVEDCVNVSSYFEYKKSKLLINLSLDYISWPSRRYINLFGEDGSIHCDLNSNILEIKKRKTNEFLKFDFSKISRNEIFLAEIKNFISFVQGKESPKVDLEEGFKSLRFALAAKDSLYKKIPINLKEF